ncbi:MAG: hypothetical protein QOH72_1645 [Solirubrobacteraceae bacterium]|jgi:hypothetical protein|nr:hypothetical protein [Solirubrobacteraceae bacterium]
MSSANALRWDGAPGHYEVHYVTLTDPASGIGVWIRYTLRAPLDGAPAECALWLLAMAPDGDRFARKATFPAHRLEAHDDPFRLCLAGADLSDRGAAGVVADGAWELSWEPRLAPYRFLHPVVQRAGVSRTELVLPHADLVITGTVRLGERTLELDRARGAQAHVWGTRHAARWAWAHCNDLRTADGHPRPDTFVDAVSVYVERLGRELGPSTPVVGRFRGDDFAATDPLALVRARSSFGLSTWRFEARAGRRRVVGEVDAPRETLAGVTYHDPDGRPAYCYNSEVASMRLSVWDRTARGRFGWTLRDTLVADGRAHFEYGQRASVADVELLLP